MQMYTYGAYILNIMYVITIIIYIIHALCAYSIHMYFNIRHTVYIVSLHVSPVWVFPFGVLLHLTATGTVVICRHDTLQWVCY